MTLSPSYISKRGMQTKSRSQFFKKLVPELKSKSPLFMELIKKVDEQLSIIPVHDVEGCDTEESIHFDSYVSSLSSVSIKEESGNRIYPIDDPLAIKLIYDELKTRRDEEMAAQAIAEKQDG